MPVRFLLVAALFQVVSSPLAAQDIGLEATVNASRVGVEDILELTVEVRGADAGRLPEPTLPDLPDFEVAGRSSSSRVSIVNGRMSATQSYIYSLIPRREGAFEVGSAVLELGGNVYRSEPISVEVVAGSVLSRGGGRSPLDPFSGFGASPFRRRRDAPKSVGEDQLFLLAESDSEDVYVGEQILITYRLYTKVQIMGIQVDEDPSLSGFWVEEVDLPKNPETRQTTYAGEQWYTVPLKQRIVFPTRAGRLEIPAITFSMAVRVSSGDPFDSFFSRASEPLARSTKPIQVDVQALPEVGRPSDFSGAVGQYDLVAELNRTQVEAGDAVSLNVTLSGRGNLRSVSELVFDEPAGFRTFEPKVDEDLVARSSGFSGAKTWEFVMVPESGGSKEIGPIRFSFFDPSERAYRAAMVDALGLDVSGSAGTSPESGLSGRSQVRLLRNDIRFLKPAPSVFGISSSAFYRSRLFWLLTLLPVLANLGLLAYKKRSDAVRGDETRYRRSKAERMARSRLKRAASLASEASMEFYDETAAAIRTYLADKQGSSASGLTLLSIEEFLREIDADDRLREQIVGILSECDQARFTPGARRAEEMRALLSRAQAAIAGLEKKIS